MASDNEQFNAHQTDVRQRVDSFAKALFILSGGTLTVSIGIFTSPGAPNLETCLNDLIKISWWSLFVAIICLVLTLFAIIARDYATGERWRKKIKSKSDEDIEGPAWVDAVIWILGILGLLAFLVGMLLQAFVATSVL